VLPAKFQQDLPVTSRPTPVYHHWLTKRIVIFAKGYDSLYLSVHDFYFYFTARRYRSSAIQKKFHRQKQHNKIICVQLAVDLEAFHSAERFLFDTRKTLACSIHIVVVASGCREHEEEWRQFALFWANAVFTANGFDGTALAKPQSLEKNKQRCLQCCSSAQRLKNISSHMLLYAAEANKTSFPCFHNFLKICWRD